jgi:Acetyltransferase (GNAT) domain
VSAPAIAPLAIRFVDPVTDPLWLALVRKKAAGLFHSPPWIRAVSETYGFPVRACVVLDRAGEPAGGIAFCELDDVAGHRIVSLPFSDNCDPLFTSIEDWRALLLQLKSEGIPVHLRCLSEHRVSADGSLSIAKRARWHQLSVSASQDEIWHAFAPSVRRAIRLAERAGVEIRPMSGDAGRESFHRIHVALRKTKYRLLAQPARFFQAIEQRFQEIGAWHSLAAFLGGRMIAATVYLRWGDVLYFKFNASAPDGLHARPNNLLVWAGIRLAKSLGCSALDLGPSDDDQPGLVRFKRTFGAEELELRFLRWTPPGWQQDQPDTRRMLGEMTRLLTEPTVPDEITARAGDSLYRFFA